MRKEYKLTLSLCMIVKDEEKTLERCLESIRTFVDEIIIVDTGSQDKTKDIAKKFNAKIFDFEWVNDFAKARNFAFSKATKEYILWLDGDDFIDEENIEKIEKLIKHFNKDIQFVSGLYVLGRDAMGNVSYSLRRNRIVKRECGFRWIGHVHEYLEVFGTGIDGDFAIEHGKVKAYSNRNLQIFKEMDKNKEEFTIRDIFYYGNELYDNGEYEEAIKKYREFLETKKGWIEDQKVAYYKIINCYRILGERDMILNVAFESFSIDVPKAEICCALGEYFIEESLYNQSAFWYRCALDSRHEKGNASIDNKEYYTWIPALQLCLCYFNLGKLNCSYFFNELAESFTGDPEKIRYNKNYFKEEFKRQGIEAPNLEYPLRISNYINYL
ncbi:glycosyltransferase family 2 protein [uncultured Clostridium sp.]|uniref:glycosyltransferase family 2 protein n=1 Tax=uncultured Clostridium sp. TaxID=59620 RepID=UPI00262120B0|nr:glycosyltransferase family 2 protein [uncultured Clostridium sp.]